MRVRGAADDGDCIPELLAQSVEPAALVFIAEQGGAGEQFVVGGYGGPPTQLRVEVPQQRVLAPRGGREIRCAVDDAAAGDEHSSNCR